MKLLPYITNFVKDASKAVKRINNIEFKKTEESTLTELLGIPTLLVTMYSLCREGCHDVLHLCGNSGKKISQIHRIETSHKMKRTYLCAKGKKKQTNSPPCSGQR